MKIGIVGGGRMIQIQCSNCGAHTVVAGGRSRYISILHLVDTDHWGSCGSALYCPKCTETWKERNGDRPMNSREGTIETMMEWMGK